MHLVQELAQTSEIRIKAILQGAKNFFIKLLNNLNILTCLYHARCTNFYINTLLQDLP